MVDDVAILTTGTDLLLFFFVITNIREFFFGGPTGFMLYITCGLVLLSCFLNPFWFRTKFKQLAARNERVAAAAAAGEEGKRRD